MAKQITTEKAVSEFKQQLITAGYIVGGQAIGAQLNGLAVPAILGGSSATVQQAARVGLPLTLGMVFTMFTKNKHLRGLAMGLGVQGVMELIKFVMPDWTPSQGLMEGSEYLWDDGTLPAQVTPQPQLPKETGHVSQIETLFEDTVEV
ncbi:hypothetical protein NC796_01885 [Aliifodinibius sp. S!AR15-10]|uniref:hypothetical protein n=1 Tax=Aliifodinibius sp. S!AR15-10 TaxID=2950437 RepID=UPI00285D2741|nr:hypothetical protein [Aliifodinibius sp. S!AR15-10]MDR8389869.1 hypothetical protein [Aliifodinibius sp. S!AR15-10]